MEDRRGTVNICGFSPESINEGEGLRALVFISGCEHYCEGCFSSETWDYSYGEEFTHAKQIEIINAISNNPLLDGITLLGGDPFFSAKEVLSFIKLLKQHIPDINIWSYTGFTFEEILKTKKGYMIDLLKEIDVLIDGRYIDDKRDLTLSFRGSSNQRIIDVKKSLAGNVVLYSM